MEKITNAQMFATIADLLSDNADVVEFCNKQIASIERKAEKAKERAAQKRLEGDAFRDQVEAALTSEFQTADEILAKVAGDDETITKAKVIARLSQLVKIESAEKEQAKIDGRTVMTYKLAD